MPIEAYANIDADDIALPQHPVGRWDTVNDLLIDARAESRRKAVKALKGRRRPLVVAYQFLRPAIKLRGAHPDTDTLLQSIEHVGYDLASMGDPL